MATRSTIALEFADGSVGQVYAHWDGYLEHNGKILFENYSDPFKLRELIDNGSISILGPDIGEKHEFDNPFKYATPEWETWQNENRKVCTFYGRDRGETDVDAHYFKDFNSYCQDAQFEEYNYILREVDGQAVWFVAYYDTDDKFVKLEDALKAEAE